MRNVLFALALGASLAPLAAAAQPGPDGPPPEMRAKMEAMRADAKAAITKSISADHLTQINAVVGAFNAGTVTPLAAATQIDAILSVDESKAILDQAKALREKQRAAREAAMGGGPGPNGPPPGMGPGGGPPPGAPPNGGGEGRRTGPDAGRFVLQVFADPQKLRDAMMKARDQQQAPK